MDFAANLKRICNAQGTSPTALLLRMKISTSKLSLWNNGSLPKADMIERLAKELGVKPYEFFIDEPIDRFVSQDEEDLVRIFRGLSRKQQHELMCHCYALQEPSKI